MSKILFACAVVFLVCLNWSSALPVKDQAEVEDLMYKLQQLKQLNDEYLYFNRVLLNEGAPALSFAEVVRPNTFGRNQRSLDSIGGGNLLKRSLDSIGGGNLLKNSPKAKRSLNNSDRRTLLYNYYARGLAPMYDKRNFDEIDRYSKFSGKRNMDFSDQFDRANQISKRNFDEIDRWAGFNSRLNHERNLVDYAKRNFDEIDRYGKFNKRPFREVEDLGGPIKHASSLGDEMAVINEYLQ